MVLFSKRFDKELIFKIFLQVNHDFLKFTVLLNEGVISTMAIVCSIFLIYDLLHYPMVWISIMIFNYTLYYSTKCAFL